MNQDQVWSQVQEELRFQLAKRTYDMWLKNTSVLSADNNTYRIGVPSKLAKDWLADRFSGLIQETLQAVTGTEVDIDFVISPTGHRPAIANVDVDDAELGPATTAATTAPSLTPMRRRFRPPSSTFDSSSRRSSSATTRSSPMPPPRLWPRRRATATTRCSCTAASVLARPT